MIAIAESGSTKCEWVILNNEGAIEKNFKTQGFNPDFHSTDFVSKSLNNFEELSSIKNNITQVFFYGASCSSNNLNAIISNGLQQVFKNASITVDHDLLAAAYSLYEGEPIISCILGTGSNSAYFDGEKIKESIPALGFILGDEGGGGYFGKKLFSDYFYNRLPQKMHDDFSQTYHLSWDIARKKVYGNIHANVYLASFMPFIAKYKKEDYVNDMIKEGMSRFIDIHVSCFSNYKNCKVGFVGTIAHVFKDIIKEELNKQGFELGQLIKSPILELVDYHKKYKLLSFENEITSHPFKSPPINH